jgi:hypothetical protein
MDHNVVTEMAELFVHSPGLSKDPAVLIAWYEAKAVMLRHAGLTAAADAALEHADEVARKAAEVVPTNDDGGLAVAA